MFSAAHMSKAEVDFIRLYVQVTHKRFAALQAVLSLAHPDNLALLDMVHATELVAHMDWLQNDFDGQIQQLQLKHNIPSKRLPPAPPTNEQLADFVVMSFFKVVGVMNTAHGLLSKTKQNGWFSGKPKEWGAIFDKLVTDLPENQIDSTLATYLKSVAKFFPKYQQPGNWSKLFPPPHQEFYDDDEDDEEWDNE